METGRQDPWSASRAAAPLGGVLTVAWKHFRMTISLRPAPASSDHKRGDKIIRRSLILAPTLVCLLLVPAVALAREISITTDPEGCLECWTSRNDIKSLAVYSSGWLDNELITIDEWKDGQHVYNCPSCGGAINAVFDHPLWRDFPCSEGDVLGEWRSRLTGDTSGRVGEAAITVVEDCTPAEEEFVPEAGTILLVGSGPVALAGYATLRFRPRETPG